MKKQFWLSATTLALFIFAAGVPSPLYTIFQQQWHFSTVMLTVIFAAYAFSFILSLLFTGRLSDYIGRRPVLVMVLAIEMISMAIFSFADGTAMLIIARLLQGIATGIASATLSARLLDSQPTDNPGLAGVTTTIVPVASIGAGSLVASLLIAYAPWPTHLVFWAVFAASLVLALLLGISRETNVPQPGWWQALKPKVLLPVKAYGALKVMGPSLIACWALIGFYLSLGPSIAMTLLHDHGNLLGGLLIFGLTTPAALLMYCFRKWDNTKLVRLSNALACIGLLATMYSLLTSSPVLFLVGTIIAGMGFGPAFMSAFRGIMAHAEPNNRAGLASAVYIISYIAFGVPTVVASMFLDSAGLRIVAMVYAFVLVLLYALTVLRSRRRFVLI